MSAEIMNLQSDLVMSQFPFWSHNCSPLSRGFGISFLLAISVRLPDIFLKKNMLCYM